MAQMEAVLDTYAQPHDPLHPVVCLDECPVGLTAPRRPSIPARPKRRERPEQPARPGQLQKVDYEYERCGTASLFAAFAPRLGWRMVQARERRTASDFALFLREVVEHFPDAEQITVVLDNLNTHHLHTLYDAFPPAEARRIARKLTFVKTPVHGSWLNMIEIEWSVLARQCLRHRHVPDVPTLQAEVDAWADARNASGATVDWRFTSTDARRVLHRLYPIIDPSLTDSQR